MGFRVYDKKKKKWVNDIYLTQDGELIKNDKSILGWGKPTFVSQNRYVYQQSTEIFDRDNVEVFIGDYLEATVENDEVIKGLVTFSEELQTNIILCFENDKYYILSNEVSDRIKVISNVFEDK